MDEMANAQSKLFLTCNIESIKCTTSIFVFITGVHKLSLSLIRGHCHEVILTKLSYTSQWTPNMIWIEMKQKLFNSFAANVVNQQLGPRPPILFKFPPFQTFTPFQTFYCLQGVFSFDKSELGYLWKVIESKTCKIKILENGEASYGMVLLTLKINATLRKHVCQKIRSERVKMFTLAKRITRAWSLIHHWTSFPIDTPYLG